MILKNTAIWNFIKNIIINFLILLAFSGLFNNSLHITKPIYGLAGSFLITVMYMFIRPLLMLVSIVPIIMTFGIFIVIINAFLIVIVSYILAPNFEITSFGSALFLAVFISIFNMLLNRKDRNIVIKKF